MQRGRDDAVLAADRVHRDHDRDARSCGGGLHRLVHLRRSFVVPYELSQWFYESSANEQSTSHKPTWHLHKYTIHESIGLWLVDFSITRIQISAQ